MKIFCTPKTLATRDTLTKARKLAKKLARDTLASTQRLESDAKEEDEEERRKKEDPKGKRKKRSSKK
ncbi:hypothetical protein R1flu_016993 [Riccia fluitans]|uniref:Uncharacterized protein n=1 Tax=Riccia fluitans TaxID=41844 RepID=A0ABD1YRG0_9MARC